MNKTPAEKQRSRRICIVNIAAVTFLSIAILMAIEIFRGSILSNPINPRPIATAIESAVNNFHTEYGTMPDVKSHITTDSADGIKLLTILRGMENPSTAMQNSRSISFLSLKEGSNKRGGLIYSKDGSSIEGLFDHRGNPYVVELDTKNAGSLHFTHGNRTIDLKDRRVAVYSPGKDGKLGTRDDFTTW